MRAAADEVAYDFRRYRPTLVEMKFVASAHAHQRLIPMIRELDARSGEQAPTSGRMKTNRQRDYGVTNCIAAETFDGRANTPFLVEAVFVYAADRECRLIVTVSLRLNAGPEEQRDVVA